MKSTSPSPVNAVNQLWWLETGVIFLLCYLKAGWPPPDANEAHYLAKARHYWDAGWCADDFFLNSADAHVTFYWTFGWFAALVSLPTAAWVGRLITWLLMAWSWQRLSFAIAPIRYAAILSGGLMIVLSTVGHMAGEWIIGGVEAKGFAFVLLFLGLEQLVRGRWWAVWVLLGASAALHVLVGGWSVVAAGFAWLLAGKERPSFVAMLPSLAIGFSLSLLGLLPVLLLNRGVDPAITREANLIYVFERLPHHLVVNQFDRLLIARHVGLMVLFALMARYVKQIDAQPGVQRLAGFVYGAMVIAGVGVVIDQSTLYLPNLAATLLRFYWYRLSDALVPCGVALLVPLVLWQLAKSRPQLAMAGVLAATVGIVGPIAAWNLERQQHFLPGSILQAWQQQRQSVAWEDAVADFADWRNACVWIQEHTPSDAIFLTPRGQQTFKWYASRAEVVAVKDIPQDARGIVEWRERISTVFIPPVSELGFAVLTDDQITTLANQYQASYVIMETHKRSRPTRFTKVYPTDGEANESYAVLKITQP